MKSNMLHKNATNLVAWKSLVTAVVLHNANWPSEFFARTVEILIYILATGIIRLDQNRNS